MEEGVFFFDTALRTRPPSSRVLHYSGLAALFVTPTAILHQQRHHADYAFYLLGMDEGMAARQSVCVPTVDAWLLINFFYCPHELYTTA
jgi:hypothetical protein